MGRLFRNQPAFSRGHWLPALSRLPNRRAVALTIDDGPTPETTHDVLALLAEHGAVATFFVSGERVEQAPHLIPRILEGGHEVFAHGWSHIRLQHEPPEVLHREMERTENLLAQFRPTPSPYLVRLPYGSGARDAATHRAIRAWRDPAQLALWTRSMDDHRIAVEEANIVDVELRCRAEVGRLMKRPRLDGSILLLHENPYNVDAPLNHRVAPLLLRHLLPALAKRGLQVERLTPLPSPSVLSRYVLTASV
ncbi:MAG: polysaccharide deacetylase family protein [Caulobacteraceae bacterium]